MGLQSKQWKQAHSLEPYAAMAWCRVGCAGALGVPYVRGSPLEKRQRSDKGSEEACYSPTLGEQLSCTLVKERHRERAATVPPSGGLSVRSGQSKTVLRNAGYIQVIPNPAQD